MLRTEGHQTRLTHTQQAYTISPSYSSAEAQISFWIPQADLIAQWRQRLLHFHFLLGLIILIKKMAALQFQQNFHNFDSTYLNKSDYLNELIQVILE